MNSRLKSQGFTLIKGFTLIEVMIVVVVVAILVAVALPSYQQQIIKTRRSLAAGELIKVQARQEQFFVNNKRYATDLTDLGYGAASYGIDSNGNPVAAAAANRIYVIQLAAGASATAFTLEAVPQLAQAKDAHCETLVLTSLGVKSVSAGATMDADYCW